MSFIFLYGLLPDFSNMHVHAYVYLQLNTEVHSLSQQQNVTGQAVEMLESPSVRRCWVWCVPELHQSAFSSMATRRNLTDWDITELILELDSDAHSSENEDISVQNDSDTVDTTDTNFTQWTVLNLSRFFLYGSWVICFHLSLKYVKLNYALKKNVIVGKKIISYTRIRVYRPALICFYLASSPVSLVTNLGNCMPYL